jgi:hypothetical protein
MVIEMTVHVRVSDFEKGLNWYKTLHGKNLILFRMKDLQSGNSFLEVDKTAEEKTIKRVL